MSLRLRQILLFVLALGCYAYVLPRWSDWSQNSRLDLVLALVDDGTVAIDRHVANTGDYAIYKGHAYSDKAPGTAFMAVPWYWALRPLLRHPLLDAQLARISQGPALTDTLWEEGTGLRADKLRFALTQYALTMLAVALPAALLLPVFYRALLHLGAGPAPALAGAVGYGLGSTAAVYAANLYGHQLVAALLFGGFWVAWSAPAAPHGRLPAHGLLCGLLLGWAAIGEFPAVCPAAIIGFYALYRRRWPWAAPLALGCALPLGLMVAHNLVAFQSLLPIGYAYSAHWGEQFNSGMMGITYPRPEALWGLTFGPYRGLFVRAPWLLLALPGYLAWWRSGRLRAEWWVALLVPLTIYIVYSSSAQLWWGGFTAGPRYLVPALPFLAMPAVWWLAVGFKHRPARAVALLLVGLSVAATWAEALAGQLFPPESIRAPWQEYVWPAWAAGDIARNLGMAVGLRGPLSVLPLLLFATALTLLLAMPAGQPRPGSSRRGAERAAPTPAPPT